MRRLIVLEHISLDGVIQAPGGADEDRSGGFAQGGWIEAYSDEILGAALRAKMNQSFDLLLGRKTYDIWAPYWPLHGEIWPRVNAATKFVASTSLSSAAWKPSIILSGDIGKEVAKIKGQAGPDLNLWGSADLAQTLFKKDLVDALWLMIYPLTLGRGKRLFGEGTIPATFTLTENQVSSKGVIIAEYERGLR